jgi:hypothetical protein
VAQPWLFHGRRHHLAADLVRAPTRSPGTTSGSVTGPLRVRESTAGLGRRPRTLADTRRRPVCRRGTPVHCPEPRAVSPHARSLTADARTDRARAGDRPLHRGDGVAGLQHDRCDHRWHLCSGAYRPRLTMRPPPRLWRSWRRASANTDVSSGRRHRATGLALSYLSAPHTPAFRRPSPSSLAQSCGAFAPGAVRESARAAGPVGGKDVPEAGNVQGDVHMHIFDERWAEPWLFLGFGEECPERVTAAARGGGVIARRQS